MTTNTSTASLFSRLGVLALIGAGLFAWTSCSSKPGPSSASSPKDQVREITLIVSGDTSGWIVPCGCTSNQSGGLLRRGSYVIETRKEGNKTLLVDAGGAPGGTSEYDKAKFAAIMQGEASMIVAAHNIGAAEAKLGAKELRKLGISGVKMITCNVRDKAGELLGQRSLVQELVGQRIALIGVLSESFRADGFTIDPPREAILAALAEIEGRYDRAIVLAYVPHDELLALAAELPEVDAVVGGPTGQSVPPQFVGPTLVASATNKGKFLAEIKLPAGKGQPLSGTIVEMNDQWSDDGEQKNNLERFYELLARTDFAPEQTSFAPSLPADPPAGFAVAGAAACAECHEAEYTQWRISGHQHAWVSLTKTGSHVDSDCQRCHTTGYGMPGGFSGVKRTPDHIRVGCESCHGPSLAHANEPTTPTAYAGQAANQCTKCHDRENSPLFSYDEYWQRIKHGEKSEAQP